MATAAQLIDRHVAQFDVSRTEALDVLNAVHKRFVAEAGWRTSTVSIGTTVANQANYSLPVGVVALRAVRILTAGGYENYDVVSLEQMWDYDASNGELSGNVFALDYDTSGNAQIRLLPAPDTSGLAITGLQDLEAADLTDGVNQPIIPEDFVWTGLWEGMQAYGFSQTDERDDMAAPHFQAMAAEVERLKARKNSRVSSSDDGRIRVWRYDFG